MEEEYRAPFLTTWVRRILSKIAWSILTTLWEFSIPIIQYISLFCLMVVFASVGYYLLYVKLLPQALMSEPLYFDFSQSTPIAKLSILSRERQWYYTGDYASARKRQGIDSTPIVSPSINDETLTHRMNTIRNRVKFATVTEIQQGKKQFLRAGFRYSIDIIFGLARSPKNLLLGKFMVFAKVINSEGNTVATSTRPVVIPYQSYITLFLDAVVKYPLRSLGLLRISEVNDVHIPIMNEFREPLESVTSGTLPGIPITTEYLELQLSSADVDIDYAMVTLMPMLTGLTYAEFVNALSDYSICNYSAVWYMHYFPYISCIVGVTLGTAVQFLFLCFLVIMRYASLVLVDEDDDENSEDVGEEGEGVGTRPREVTQSQAQAQVQISSTTPLSSPLRSGRGSLSSPGVRAQAELIDSSGRSRIQAEVRSSGATASLEGDKSSGSGRGGGRGSSARRSLSSSVSIERTNQQEKYKEDDRGARAPDLDNRKDSNADSDGEVGEGREGLRRRLSRQGRSQPSTVM